MVDEGLLKAYCEHRKIRLEELPSNLVESLLSSVKASIEHYTGRVVEEKEVTETHPAGKQTYTLRLYPIIEVSKVTVDNVETTNYTLDEYYGLIKFPSTTEGTVKIEYKAGDPENQALYDQIILEVFYQRIYEYTHGMYKGLKAIKEGDVQITYLSTQPWLPIHVTERLEGLKRPMVGVLMG